MSACSLIGGWSEIRYLLEVTVDTPLGPRTGRSTIIVKARESKGLTGSLVQSRLQGEAVVIDLPNGQKLFALIRSRQGERAAFLEAHGRLLPESTLKHPNWKVRFRAMQEETRPASVPAEAYPVLVTFSSLHRPETMIMIDPGNNQDRESASYRVRSVTVKASKEDVPPRIIKELPWLSDLPPERGLIPRRNYKEQSLITSISGNDFISRW